MCDVKFIKVTQRKWMAWEKLDRITDIIKGYSDQLYMYAYIFFTKAPFDANGTFSVIIQYHLKISVLQHWFEY